MSLVVGRAQSHCAESLGPVGGLHRHCAVVRVLAFQNYLLPVLEPVGPVVVTEVLNHLIIDDVLAVGGVALAVLPGFGTARAADRDPVWRKHLLRALGAKSLAVALPQNRPHVKVCSIV